MDSINLAERVEKIRKCIKKARFQRALDELEELGKLIDDKELNREILVLNARFNREFKDIISGVKSKDEDFNKIILSITYVLNEAMELAEDKFEDNSQMESGKKFIEKISLESNKFHQSIKGLNLQEEDKNNLLNAVSIMSEHISKSQGKRLLWIDDKPHKIIGERRFFRALGLEIVTGNSRELILKLLEQDGDFDMIISDIQWLTGGIKRVTYGGLDVVKEIREMYKDSFIGKLRVCFYTGYRKEQIDIIDRQAGILGIENSAVRFSIDSLLVDVFTTLAEQKNRVLLTGSKIPT
ncbi:MAG: hypothetical protein AAFY91_03250 [Bacteroidota bacterium]